MKKTFVTFAHRLLAVIALALPLAAGTKGTWTGWVTDEHCGAKGAKAEHKDCAVKCLEQRRQAGLLQHRRQEDLLARQPGRSPRSTSAMR